jgi:hypothetical protein
MDQLRREVATAAAGPAALPATLEGPGAPLPEPGGVGTPGGLRVRRSEP